MNNIANSKYNPLLDSITSLKSSKEIIENHLTSFIYNNHSKVPKNQLYLDHALSVNQIIHFSILKYMDRKESLFEENQNPKEVEYFKKRLEVLKKTPISLVEDLTRTKFNLFFAWNNAIAQKNFSLVTHDLTQYIKKLRNHCEIIGEIFNSKTNYNALINYHHPDFSSDIFENLFFNLSGDLKLYSKQIAANFKKIKTNIFEIPAMKIEQSQEIINAIWNNFDLQDNPSQILGEFNLSSKQMNLQTNHGFCEMITRGIFNKSQDYMKNYMQNNTSNKFLLEGYNNNLSIDAIVNFIYNYLLRSKTFLDNFSTNFKKITKYKGKVCEGNNLFWLFNHMDENLSINNSDEISNIFFNMTQYVIEKDLINGNLKAEEVADSWISGIKYYFDKTVDEQHILQNIDLSLGKFGLAGFNIFSLINSNNLFTQFNNTKKNEAASLSTFIKTVDLKKLFNVETSGNVNELAENYKKYLRGKFGI